MYTLDPQPVGVIFNTSCKGRYHIVVYPSGLLYVKANLIGLIQMAARYSRGGAPRTTTDQRDWRTSTIEGRRLYDLCFNHSLQQICEMAPSQFIPRSQIIQIRFHRSPNRPRLIIETSDGGSSRFTWIPVMNDWEYVYDILSSSFRSLLVVP